MATPKKTITPNLSVLDRRTDLTGRPFQVTDDVRRIVRRWAGLGMSKAGIAVQLGVSLATIDEYFAEDLVIGQERANRQVARALYNKAVEGDTRACEFWLKCRAGWKEASKVELSGPDGGPIETESKVTVTVEEILADLAKRAGEPPPSP